MAAGVPLPAFPRDELAMMLRAVSIEDAQALVAGEEISAEVDEATRLAVTATAP